LTATAEVNLRVSRFLPGFSGFDPRILTPKLRRYNRDSNRKEQKFESIMGQQITKELLQTPVRLRLLDGVRHPRKFRHGLHQK